MDFHEFLSNLEKRLHSSQRSTLVDAAEYPTNIRRERKTEDADPFEVQECPPLSTQVEYLPKVNVVAGDILPALTAYGHPPLPVPFSKPVKWLHWSKPERSPDSDTEIKSRPSSSDSFGKGDLDTAQGIVNTSERSVKVMREKCARLETETNLLTEQHQDVMMLKEKELQTLRNSQSHTMATIGALLRKNEEMHDKTKELHESIKEIQMRSVSAKVEAEKSKETKIKQLTKVIKEKRDRIERMTNEIRFIRNFAEDKERVEASIQTLKEVIKDRFQQQQQELENVYLIQETEQQKLQSMAVDRLLALTEENYNKALENVDGETMAVFYKHCKVRDALSVWLQRDKGLSAERSSLNKRIHHVLQRRQTALKYLRKFGAQADSLFQKVQELRSRNKSAKTEFQKTLHKYEQESGWVMPVVESQLRVRMKRLRHLEYDKAVRKAEVMRIKQLSHIVQQECSTMEKAFVGAIRFVMEQRKVRSIKDLTWLEREMVLRRVFVMMNMENMSEQQDFADLAKRAEVYVIKMEIKLGLADLMISGGSTSASVAGDLDQSQSDQGPTDTRPLDHGLKFGFQD